MTRPTASPRPSAPLSPPERHRMPRAPRRATPVPTWWRDTSVGAFWGVLLGVTALWVAGGGIQALTTLGGALTTLGRLTGLIASALLLVQVFLMARIPWFEQAWGQDALARTHRTVGFTSFTLMWAHIVLIALGYAAGSTLGVWGTVWDMVVNYPGMLLAVAGTAALCLVVATSIRKARARLRYESWHLIHLYGYLGAGLALPHQLWTGAEFTVNTWATVFWWSLYGVCLGAVLIWRVAVPAWRSLRAPLRVVEVRAEGPDATTVVVGGSGVARLQARAGQFFQWRFVDGPGWTRGHPYSLSAAPDGQTLQLTAAHVGDGSRRLATLRPGTRVLLEGPYGRLHAGVRTREKVLLMGSGIGIAPMKALLEDLGGPEVTVVHRVRDRAQAVLGREVQEAAQARGARHVVVSGPRVTGRDSWLPQSAAHLDDSSALRELVPDVADRDVFLCGSEGWMTAAREAALGAGVPAEHIHLERFSY